MNEITLASDLKRAVPVLLLASASFNTDSTETPRREANDSADKGRMKRTNQNTAFGKEEELTMENTNQNAAFGKGEDLTMERTNQNTAFDKGEELTLERTNQNAAFGKGEELTMERTNQNAVFYHRHLLTQIPRWEARGDKRG